MAKRFSDLVPPPGVARAAAMSAVKPADEPSEASETCRVSMSAAQKQELNDNGTVTLTADDGETVIVTSEAESPDEEANEPGESGE